MVQLFWGCFFDDVAVPFETSHFDPFLFQKLYDLDDPSLFDMFNHQRLHHFHWFLLWFCTTTLWSKSCFNAIWHGNFIYYPPESPKVWSFSLIFAVVLHHYSHLNHQRFDHFHWFLLWFCTTTLWSKSCFNANWVWKLYLLPSWITKGLIIFIDFCCCFASLFPPESPKIWSFSWIFAVVLHHYSLK